MSKKIIGLLLALCLVVGLLPITALAANGQATVKFGFSSHRLSGYDIPIYTKNASEEVKDTTGATFTRWYQAVKDANEENYNAKIVWHSGDEGPTIYLRGFKFDEINNETSAVYAKNSTQVQTYGITTPKGVPSTIVLQGEDNLLETKFGITYNDDLTIKSENNGKLTILGSALGISSYQTTGASLTINANLDVTVMSYYHGYASHTIMTRGADLTIEGGTINLKNLADKKMCGIVAHTSGDIYIKGGTITANSVIGANPDNGTIWAQGGKFVMSGGDVTLIPNKGMGLFAHKGIEINGGKLDITSPNYFGMNAGTNDEPADTVINGGTVKISAKAGAFFNTPIVGSALSGFSGKTEYLALAYDGSYLMSRYPWLILSDAEINIATKPTLDPNAATTAPTTDSSANPTSAPTTAPTTAPTENNTDGQSGGAIDSNTILLIVAAVMAVAFAVAVVLIVVKRKKS